MNNMTMMTFNHNQELLNGGRLSKCPVIFKLYKLVKQSTPHILKSLNIYAFDLVPTDLGEGYINLVHQGNVGVYARFSKPTTVTISAIAFCECPGLLLIDNTREVRQL